MANQQNTFTEVVPPWNNRIEDRLVFSLVAVILIIASALMLWLYPSQNEADKRVPKPLLHDLTALGIAAEEILILQDLEGEVPAVAELVEMGITPFASDGLSDANSISWTQQEACIVGTKTIDSADFQLRLLWLNPDQPPGYELNWRQLDGQQTTTNLCTNDSGWNTVLNRIDKGHENHAH